MTQIVDVHFGERTDSAFILELFNSPEFLENGMRKASDSTLTQFSSENQYFNFDSGNGFLVFVEKNTSKQVGSVKVSTSLRNQVATISGGVSKNYFGTGYASASLIETMRFLFANYPIERIEMNILASNTRSLRFHDKMGFLREGVKRRAWFCNGKLQDQVIMGLLREEFVALYGNVTLIRELQPRVVATQ